ncbi:MAG: histidine phosphatase family protein [Alphaproteobacteria bacterium]|nr:histidine phosphatase family protein [Alphaproteobacteria bacterium]
MTARLYIVRHGNTFDRGDVVTRVGGRTDLDLSVSGRAQAEALAAHFAANGTHFATARSSPLKRTRQTAGAILDAQPDAPELATDLFLREIDYGPDENQPEDKVIARIGRAALEAWEQNSVPPPGWRVDPDAIVGNWQELFARLRATAGAHLIVTSNGVARFALEAAGAHRSDAKLSTGAYGVIDVDGDNETVRSWNIRP